MEGEQAAERLGCKTTRGFPLVPTPQKTNGWIPKMMGLGRCISFQTWLFWVSMLAFGGVSVGGHFFFQFLTWPFEAENSVLNGGFW